MGKYYNAVEDLGLNAEKVCLYVLMDQMQAGFYKIRSDQKLHRIEQIFNEQGRLQEKELVSDRPGRTFSSASFDSRRHTLGRQGIHEKKIIQAFAKQIAIALKKAYQEQVFDELTLIAEPRFLGVLRQVLDPQLCKLVKCEVQRDYVYGQLQETLDLRFIEHMQL